MNGPDDGYPALRQLMGRRSSAADLARLDAAHALAARVHDGQLRYSGDPYIGHPVAVATLVAEWGQPFTLVLAALLHDVPEELDDLGPVRATAGRRVARLTRDLYRLDRGPGLRRPPGVRRMTAYRRQVVILKLADRLHNARTWDAVPRDRARAKATQTIDVFTPVAEALGMAAVGQELLALARSVLDQEPAGYPGTTANGTAGTTGKLPHGLLRRAVAVLPAGERERYHQEWTADLDTVATHRDRVRFAVGLVWSALAIRAASIRRPA